MSGYLSMTFTQRGVMFDHKDRLPFKPQVDFLDAHVANFPEELQGVPRNAVTVVDVEGRLESNFPAESMMYKVFFVNMEEARDWIPELIKYVTASHDIALIKHSFEDILEAMPDDLLPVFENAVIMGEYPERIIWYVKGLIGKKLQDASRVVGEMITRGEFSAVMEMLRGQYGVDFDDPGIKQEIVRFGLAERVLKTDRFKDRPEDFWQGVSSAWRDGAAFGEQYLELFMHDRRVLLGSSEDLPGGTVRLREEQRGQLPADIRGLSEGTAWTSVDFDPECAYLAVNFREEEGWLSNLASFLTTYRHIEARALTFRNLILMSPQKVGPMLEDAVIKSGSPSVMSDFLKCLSNVSIHDPAGFTRSLIGCGKFEELAGLVAGETKALFDDRKVKREIIASGRTEEVMDTRYFHEHPDAFWEDAPISWRMGVL